LCERRRLIEFPGISHWTARCAECIGLDEFSTDIDNIEIVLTQRVGTSILRETLLGAACQPARHPELRAQRALAKGEAANEVSVWRRLAGCVGRVSLLGDLCGLN